MTKETGAELLPSNTAIWDKFEKTDPNFTKGFKKAGGHGGTAINPVYVYKKLTEQFGPCGSGWGYDLISSEYFDGHTLKGSSDKQIVHVVQINLWYKGSVKPIMGVGTTTLVGSNKNGSFTDDEYFKKSITDALTNAAKMLGCSADVFMGLYDDNKYVNEVKAEFNQAPPPVPTKSIKVRVLEYISQVKTQEDWKKITVAMSHQKDFVDKWDEVNPIIKEAYDNWVKSQTPPTLTEEEVNQRRMNG